MGEELEKQERGSSPTRPIFLVPGDEARSNDSKYENILVSPSPSNTIALDIKNPPTGRTIMERENTTRRVMGDNLEAIQSVLFTDPSISVLY